MTPIIEVSEQTLGMLNPEVYKVIETPTNPILSKQIIETPTEPKDLEGYIFMPGEITPQGYGDLDINSARVSEKDYGIREARKRLEESFMNTSSDSMKRYFIGNINRDTALKLNSVRGRKTPLVNLMNKFLKYLHSGLNGESVYNSQGHKMDIKEIEAIYSDVVGVKSPWRAEWSEDFYEQREDGLYVLRDFKLDSEDNLISGSREKLQKIH